jgi:hypothetical protein
MALLSSPTVIGNTVSLNEVVANINISYAKYYEDWITKHAVMRMFYKVREVGGGEGMNFTVSESMVGTGVAHQTGEGDDPFQGQISPGYSKNITVSRLTYSLPLTWMFMYHNKYPEQETDIIRGVAISTAKRMEYDMAMPFTYCTSTAVTNIDGNSIDVSTGDGLSFANSAHTLVNSSTTYRNIVANNPQLSAGALELAENLFTQQMYDNNGQQITVVPDTLVLCTDSTTFNVAKKIIMSGAPVDAPNSNVHNPYQGAYRIVRAFGIDSTFTVGGLGFTVDTTKSKQWMLVDSTNPGLYIYITQAPTVMAPSYSNGGTNFLTDTSTWKASTVYAPIALDPRFAVVSLGTGVA